MEITNIAKLLLEFQKIPKIKKTRTFLEISGYPHYENVCSNILQFFLNPNNEHGFRNLILNSLIQLADEDFNFDTDFDIIQIEREFHTPIGNKLDLLITTNKYVVVIENKIFHFLNNNLTDYSKTAASYCFYPKKKQLNIILLLNSLSEKDKEIANYDNFISITYDRFFKNLKKNIGEYIANHNPVYFIYLTDFIKSIQNLKTTTMEDKVLWNFLIENSEVVQELADKFYDYKNHVFGKIKILEEYFEKEEFKHGALNRWIWNGRPEGYDTVALVHDYKIIGNEITVDACINLKGWSIELFGRNQHSHAYLLNEMGLSINFLDKKIDQYEVDNERVIIYQFKTEETIENVANALRDLLLKIDSYAKSIEI